jgi:hypothetical protein
VAFDFYPAGIYSVLTGDFYRVIIALAGLSMLFLFNFTDFSFIG